MGKGICWSKSPNPTIEDYKTTNTSKVIKKDFSDHEMQIKIYALLRFKKYNIITRKGKLYYLMKDHIMKDVLNL